MRGTKTGSPLRLLGWNRAQRRGRAHGQRGGTFVEMTFATIFLFAPLLIGTVVVGFATINRIQLEQITRDVGIMHARGVDFSGSQNQALFYKLTQGSSFVTGTGQSEAVNGTVVISTIRKLGATDCPSGCPNSGFPVVTYRAVLGNAGLYQSWLGTPASIGTNGKVANFKDDGSARATGIETLLPNMLDGEEAYVAEGFLVTPSIAFPDVNATTQVNTFAIF